jgi:hypothetical protein
MDNRLHILTNNLDHLAILNTSLHITANIRKYYIIKKILLKYHLQSLLTCQADENNLKETDMGLQLQNAWFDHLDE